mmetsp:Transcript_119452/g.333251  ORF Transcript_119452/g.333251 Transcript_119452/m.333251 type:complete len:161 (+) Transcript_119452:67-549(+)
MDLYRYLRHDDGTQSLFPGSNSTPSDVYYEARLEVTEPVGDYVSSVRRETGASIHDLQVLDAQGLLRLIPRDKDGRLLSAGSIGHGRHCAKCVFHERKCCSKGIACQFCHHLPHEGKRCLPRKARSRQQERNQKSKEDLETRKAGIDNTKSGKRSTIISL